MVKVLIIYEIVWPMRGKCEDILGQINNKWMRLGVPLVGCGDPSEAPPGNDLRDYRFKIDHLRSSSSSLKWMMSYHHHLELVRNLPSLSVLIF